MEWSYLDSPSQADGKNCVHVFFCPHLIGPKSFRPGTQLTHIHVNSFWAGGPIIMQQIGRWSIIYYVMLPENGWSNITIYCLLITVISQSSCHTSIPCFQFIKLTPVSSFLPYYLGYDENWPSQTQTADLEVVRYSLQHLASGERCQLTFKSIL